MFVKDAEGQVIDVGDFCMAADKRDVFNGKVTAVDVIVTVEANNGEKRAVKPSEIIVMPF